MGGGQRGGAYFEINVDRFAQKRAMTQQEIKSMTRKNYSKLPEVKERQLKKSAEEVKRRNRLKSDLYKKVGVGSFFSCCFCFLAGLLATFGERLFKSKSRGIKFVGLRLD